MPPPAPNTVARPTTLGACQVRLQLSMLLVPMATRANFCARKFTSFVAFEQLNIPNAFGPVALDRCAEARRRRGRAPRPRSPAAARRSRAPAARSAGSVAFSLPSRPSPPFPQGRQICSDPQGRRPGDATPGRRSPARSTPSERRRVPGGSFTRPVPSRYAAAGRIGRGTKPPPQFGHTFSSMRLGAVRAERALVAADPRVGGRRQVGVAALAVRSQLQHAAILSGTPAGFRARCCGSGGRRSPGRSAA